MSSDPPLIIELFGQPGAGKSTLARAVAADLELQTTRQLGAAWKRQSTLAKWLLGGRAILDCRSVVDAIMLASKGRLLRVDSLSRLFRLIIKSHWLRAQTGRFVLEEGHLQELWSIFYSARKAEPDPQLLAPLVSRLYGGLNAQIVFLDVSVGDAFDRIRCRVHGRSRLDRLTELELRQHLAATAQLPYRIADAARAAGLTVERVDASLPIETTVGHLRAVANGLAPFRTEQG